MTSKVDMQDIEKEIEKILDTYFPDEMDGQMQHPSVPPAVDAILALIKKHEKEVLEKVLDYGEGKMKNTKEVNKIIEKFADDVKDYGQLRTLPTDERAKIFLLLMQILAIVIDVTPEEWVPYHNLITDVQIK